MPRLQEEDDDSVEEEEFDEEEKEKLGGRKRYRYDEDIDDHLQGRIKQKRKSGNPSIDSEAEVDTDKEEPDDDEDIEEDFIDHSTGLLENEEGCKKSNRFRVPRQAEEEDYEELERKVRARYARMHEDYECGEGDMTEVEQQALLPSVKDPKLWMVKCAAAGVGFPPRLENTAPLFTPPQTHPISSQSAGPVFDDVAVETSLGSDVAALSLNEFQNARGIADVLTEMLNALDPPNAEDEFLLSGGTLIGAIHVRDGVMVFADTRSNRICRRTGSVILSDFSDKFVALPPHFKIFSGGKRSHARYLLSLLKDELNNQTVLSGNPSVFEVQDYLIGCVKAELSRGQGTARFEEFRLSLLIIKNDMDAQTILKLKIRAAKESSNNRFNSEIPGHNEVAFIGKDTIVFTKFFMEQFLPAMSMDQIAELGRRTLIKAAKKHWQVGGHTKIQILSSESKAWSLHSIVEIPNRKRHQNVLKRDKKVKDSKKIMRPVIYKDECPADFFESF